jgi:hypothetical protein
MHARTHGSSRLLAPSGGRQQLPTEREMHALALQQWLRCMCARRRQSHRPQTQIAALDAQAQITNAHSSGR